MKAQVKKILHLIDQILLVFDLGGHSAASIPAAPFTASSEVACAGGIGSREPSPRRVGGTRKGGAPPHDQGATIDDRRID